ncbi:MAG TPA: RNA polymerase sporulation sigma factor SigK [Ruminiclostridium sp.]
MLIAVCLFIFEILKFVPFLFVGYVSNLNSFPQPLSSDEESIIIDSYKKGDEEARNILIERNLRLVAHIVKKYSSNGNDSDDLISIGTIGLIKGISSYDPLKGTKLATYAARCIENEILMSIRSNKKTQSEVSLQDPIGVDGEGNEMTLIDILVNDADSIVEEVELKMEVKRLYNKMKEVLKNREKMILELRYGLLNGNSRTQLEIGRMLGISRSYVSRIEKKAIKKLSMEFKSEG